MMHKKAQYKMTMFNVSLRFASRDGDISLKWFPKYGFITEFSPNKSVTSFQAPEA